MTRRKLMLSVLGLSLYLSGCGSGKKDQGSTGEPAPTNLDRSSSIAGAATLTDGVRPDIAGLIQRYPLSSAQKAALLAVARSMQSAITNTSSRDTSVGHAQTAITALEQFHGLGANSSHYLTRIIAYTLNTPERCDAYLAFERNLNGVVLRSNASDERSRGRQVDACTSSGYVICFINGIRTVALNAFLSRILLQSQIGDTFNNERISYENLYNPTDGFVLDLLESSKQKFRELGITFFMELVWAILLGDNGLVDLISRGLSPLFPNVARLITELRALVTASAAAIGSIGPNPEPIISTLSSAVNVNLTERKKVIIVSHSQGNFFANAIYDRLAPGLRENSLAVVHVATPTAVVSGPYTTSINDIFMTSIPTSLPANITIGFTTEDWTGHGFNEIYLNPRFAAKAKIQREIQTALNALVAPTQGGASGFFTVTLTWDGVGDVDLHVIEPNGKHVYYGDKQGTSGFLDVDNTSANGPEHYFASCESTVLQTGVYEVGINNYARATGRIATVALATTDRIYEPIRLDVGPARGGSGDSSPISVLSVLVEVDGLGRYRASQIVTRSAGKKLSTYAVPSARKGE